jgi:hypothetical protein
MKPRLALVLMLIGGSTMAQTPGKLSLTWQWGGVAAHRVLITVDSVNKESAGLLGLGNSPSVAGYLPDPRIIRGPAVAGDADGEIRLRMPAYELPPVQQGDLFAIAYTVDDMAMCVARAPAGLNAAAASAWLAAWKCVPRP